MTKMSAERLALIRGLEMPIGVKVVDELYAHIAAVEAERDALARMADAVELFAKEGTRLTVCDRGACQQVVEKKDKSDPQCKLFDALRAAGRRP